MKTGNSRTIIIASAALSALLVLGTLLGGWILARNAQPASAQNEDQQAAKPSQVTVVGSGSVTVKPDVLKITIGVSAQEETVAAAQGSVERITNEMVLKLQEMGIDPKDYATSQYNVEPVMDYNSPKGPQGTLIGFRVVSMYEITFRDLAKAPATIDALTAVGANTIYGTYFTVSNANELSKQAYESAMQDAQDRAEKIAGLSNLSLGKIVSVSEVANTPYPMPLKSEGMGGGSSIAPGQQTITTSLIVTYEAESK